MYYSASILVRLFTTNVITHYYSSSLLLIADGVPAASRILAASIRAAAAPICTHAGAALSY